MPLIDIEHLLAPVSADAPCGDNLEYDPAYLKLVEAAAGEPERQMGSSVVEAEEPKWRQIQTMALGLFPRSKDLRIALLLTRALRALHDWPGFAAGMTLTQRMLDSQWEGVYPRLDVDDDNDPTERVNAVLNLCDPDSMLEPVRRMPLIRSKVFGPVSLRVVEIAAGELEPVGDKDEAKLDAGQIDAAFLDAALEELQASGVAATQALAALDAIDHLLTERLGASVAPNLKPLRSLLARADTELRRQLDRRGPAVATQPAATASPAGQDPSAAAAMVAGTQPSALQINNRDDVMETIDKLCAYYAEREPSSPVLILLKRARFLAPRSFIEVIANVAPKEMRAIVDQIRGPDDLDGGDKDPQKK